MDSYKPIISDTSYSPTDSTMTEEKKETICESCVTCCGSCCGSIMDSMCCLSTGIYFMLLGSSR